MVISASRQQAVDCSLLELAKARGIIKADFCPIAACN